ncbi:AAA family ATPase [Asticcacaulis sp. DXS10W]|uniref:AAA family ATPase n=1 Tax=Asticcacaulis currens TaxID=2984210 RepID=A0ABT5IDG2_9CAUL|nr:AAA family ATPase [Asticcacaulis currens]MDC7694245.1 AAA family ATPase [Asticcacaulis currens]
MEGSSTIEADNFAEVYQLTNGARFFRGDLHIHTVVGSHDVTDTNATPENIVQTAVAEKLDIIAIADHNEIDAVERALKASASTGVMVVPAIELTTPQGHLLCYFPSLDALKRFHAQLALEDRHQSNSRCTNGMTDCLAKTQALGGFCMLAHVDGPKGLHIEVPGGPPHKADIISHPALLGIELKSAASTIRLTSSDSDPVCAQLGKQRLEKNAANAPLARVLNSDSHTLNAMGRNASGDQKVTRFKMQSLSFDALRLALMDSDARIRIEEEVPRNIPVISGLRLTGGFLKDQSVHFNKNLNCVIGGRGTGKSTLFEALRCFSMHPGAPKVVDSDVWPDKVEVEMIDETGTTHRLARSKDGFVYNVFDTFEGPDSLPIECYGQGETQRISEQAQTDPGALLSYLDRFTNVGAELRTEEEARIALAEIYTKIAEAQANVDQIKPTTRDLAVRRKQLKTLQDGQAKELIAASRQLEHERQVRNTILEQVKAIRTGLDYRAIKSSVTRVKASSNPSELKVGADDFAAIQKSIEEFEASLTGTESNLSAASSKLSTSVQKLLQDWTAKEAALVTQIDQKKRALESQGVTVDSAYINRLAQEESKLTQALANLNSWVPRLKDLERQRTKLATTRWTARSRVEGKRVAFASAATAKLRLALSDLNVSMKFEPNAYSPLACQLIVEKMGWRTNQVPRATVLVEKLTLPKLLDAIALKDAATIQALKTAEGIAVFNRQDADLIIERMGDPATFANLATMPVSDRPKLTVSKASIDAGTAQYPVREFNQLSLGQQQSVLLALMLSADNPNPLLIDQPEDNLDGEFIYKTLVPVLRMAKERRQIIVVTHNPNIAVLGDAEQIITLKATNERAAIMSRGSIDDTGTRDLACAVLEGAREAFTRRAKIYGVT